MHALDDTIAAIATAPGAAGLAVVRVSGSSALAVADRVFEGGGLARANAWTLHHGWALSPEDGRRLDDVVVAVFHAPASYTRENSAEFSCHGGTISARRVLDALLAAGARLARPGEFTLRAFLSGRVDLAQAEAVADLIHAETEDAADLALSHIAGELSARLRGLSERMLEALAEIEARVDFAEDVGGVEVPPHVRASLASVALDLGQLLEGAAFARAVREGVRVPLVGSPNVGKSSLFNALLGEDRAIVTDRPGTTRDRVSEAIALEGVRVTLSDTAGLRVTEDPAETIGVQRSLDALDGAFVVIWVVDGTQGPPVSDSPLVARLAGRRVLVAVNKCDLAPHADLSWVTPLAAGADVRTVRVSAKSGEGLDELRSALSALLGRRQAALAGALSNARHVDALARAQQALGRAALAAADQPGEIVALELREALLAMGEVTGETVDEALLDRIFARFCIGK